MKVAVALLLVCVAVASALHTEEQYQSYFTNFVVKYKKSYDVTEFFQRYHIFRKNIDLIDIHNDQADEGKWTFTLGVNHLADLTNEEYRGMLGFHSSKSGSGAAVHSHAKKGVPAAVDWRKQNAVTPVQDQGQCGSCWAFSAIAAMEGANFQKTGELLKLSEQMCVDCVNGGADTCDVGGEMHDCYLQVISQNGNMLESVYPYTATSGNPCGFVASEAVTQNVFTGYVNVSQGDENDLMTKSASYVVSVGIDASQFSFQLYSSGVYNEPACMNGPNELDHGVTVVGYDTDPTGGDYWIVKNSWGAFWGQSGYIWMSRGKDNQCGIATDATVPTVSKNAH